MWRSKFEEKELRSELPTARKILKDENVIFEEVFRNYILFKIKSEGVCIVAYPHKTSAGNRHVRIRNENSSNKEELMRIMEKLRDESGNDCRYHFKRK